VIKSAFNKAGLELYNGERPALTEDDRAYIAKGGAVAYVKTPSGWTKHRKPITQERALRAELQAIYDRWVGGKSC
jgi:hypothetical protein